MRMDLVEGDLASAPEPALAALSVAGPLLPPDRRPLAVYSAGLASRHSRRGVTVAARRALAALLERPREEIDEDLLARFPWERLRYPHLAAVRSRLLGSGARPATVNVTLSHLRGILLEAWRLGYLSAEELARIRDVRGVRGETLPAGRALSAGERSAIFHSCASGRQPAGARDAAL